jgi:hypothetical protein
MEMNTQPTSLEGLLRFGLTTEADDAGNPRRFTGVCYSGGLIPDYGWFGNSAIDLASIKVPAKDLFALVNHDPNQRAGKCQIQASDQQIRIDGTFLKNTHGHAVAAEFADGAPWEFSVGINATPQTFSKPTEVTVNGRTLLLDTLFVDAMVREVSFVPAGADPNTQAIAFAAKETLTMTETTIEMNRKLGEFEAKADELASTLETTRHILADTESALNESKIELDSAKERITALETELATAQENLKAAEEKLAEAATEKRFEAVRSLFSDMGREFSDEAARNYMALSDDAFALLASDIRNLAGQRTDTALFSEQATHGCSSDPQSKINTLAADLRKANTALTYEMAVAQVLRQNPTLYTETLGA